MSEKPATIAAVSQAAAISGESAGVRRIPEGRRFQPGRSGNPSGRPKGIARAVRDRTTAEERVDVLLLIADDPKQKASDRIRANELLLAYGYGKPAATAAPEGYDILEADELTREIQALTDEIRKERAA